MLGFLTTALSLVSTVAPLFTKSKEIAGAIQMISEAAPIAIAAGGEMWDQVKGAITAVRQNEATTPEQHAEIDAIEARGDAAFDMALAAAEAADAAAAAKG